MKKIEFYSKCIGDMNQYFDRLQKPGDGIELQLFPNDSKNKLKSFITPYTKVVHAPLILEKSTNSEFYPTFAIDFKNTWKIHEKYIEIINDLIQDRKIIYIMHILQPYQWMVWNKTLDMIVWYLRTLCDKFSNITFCLENENIITDPFAAPKIAKEVEKTNIGSCLDLCHAMQVIHTANVLKDEDISDFRLKDFFIENKGICKLIHLNQAKNNIRGYGRGIGHSAPYKNTSEDIWLLNHIFELYKKYDYDCPITIEVMEENYNNAQNFLQTYTLSEKISNKLGYNEGYDL